MTDSRCEDTCKAYAELGLTACEGCAGNRIPLEKGVVSMKLNYLAWWVRKEMAVKTCYYLPTIIFMSPQKLFAFWYRTDGYKLFESEVEAAKHTLRGLYSPKSCRILVNSTLTGIELHKTIIHELVHFYQCVHCSITKLILDNEYINREIEAHRLTDLYENRKKRKEVTTKDA